MTAQEQIEWTKKTISEMEDVELEAWNAEAQERWPHLSKETRDKLRDILIRQHYGKSIKLPYKSAHSIQNMWNKYEELRNWLVKEKIIFMDTNGLLTVPTFNVDITSQSLDKKQDTDFPFFYNQFNKLLEVNGGNVDKSMREWKGNTRFHSEKGNIISIAG